jgi:demethylphylloquinone reductase
MSQQSPRICILGGGFGGLYTALRLRQFPPQTIDGYMTTPELLLIDQRDRFLFSPLLYELITGELQSWEIAPPYTELLANTGVRFCQNTVTNLDLQAKQVQVQSGETVAYNKLVIALGGETPLDMVPGVAEHAIPFRTLADAYRLEEHLRRLESQNSEKIRIAIVGAGYSGVELACKLAERLGDRGRIRLVEQSSQILRTSPEFNRLTASQALVDRKVWTDLETTVDSITADTITLTYKGETDTIPVDVVLWTVGTQMHPVVQDLSVKKNQRGQLITTPTLQLVDYPDVFALGDTAECRDAEGQLVPTTAQAAFQQADYVGWNIWASLTGRPMLPFRYQALGEMMTLGKDNATLAGLGLKLEGSLAHIARRMVYLMRMPTLEHQLKVGLSWVTRPVTDLLTR